MNAMVSISARRLSSIAVAATLVFSLGAHAQQGGGTYLGDGGQAPPAAAAPSAGGVYLDSGRGAGADAGYVRAQDGAPAGYLAPSDSGQAGYLQNKSAPGGEGFVPAPADARENINGGSLMLIAYTLFWIFTLVYVVSLAKRGREAQRELTDLRNQLRELDERMEELEGGIS